MNFMITRSYWMKQFHSRRVLVDVSSTRPGPWVLSNWNIVWHTNIMIRVWPYEFSLSILRTLKSTPTLALVSSSSKSCSSKKHCNKLLFPTLELPIKSGFTSTRASEDFSLFFGCGIMNYWWQTQEIRKLHRLHIIIINVYLLVCWVKLRLSTCMGTTALNNGLSTTSSRK